MIKSWTKLLNKTKISREQRQRDNFIEVMTKAVLLKIKAGTMHAKSLRKLEEMTPIREAALTSNPEFKENSYLQIDEVEHLRELTTIQSHIADQLRSIRRLL
jgi:hypothetical protein